MARKTDDTKRKAAPVRKIPLASELETFVRIYRDTFDGEEAARNAGYEDAKAIWPDLLANPEVQARLRGYRSGVDVPARTPEAMFEHLYVQAFNGLESVLVPDVITGEIRIDWEEAAAQNAGALEFQQTIINRGGIQQRTTHLRKRSPMDVLLSVARNLGEIETGAITKEETNRKLVEHLMKYATTVPVVSDEQIRQRKELNSLKSAEPHQNEGDDPEP
jgi:phage terminase small subunit